MPCFLRAGRGIHHFPLPRPAFASVVDGDPASSCALGLSGAWGAGQTGSRVRRAIVHPRITQCPVGAGAGIAASPVSACLRRLLGSIMQGRARITIPVRPVPEGTSHHQPVSCAGILEPLVQPVLRRARSSDQSGLCIPHSKQIRIHMLFCWTSVSASIDGCCAFIPSRRKPQNRFLPVSPAVRGGQACG